MSKAYSHHYKKIMNIFIIILIDESKKHREKWRVDV